jgi:hypothetical protein
MNSGLQKKHDLRKAARLAKAAETAIKSQYPAHAVQTRIGAAGQLVSSSQLAITSSPLRLAPAEFANLRRCAP